MTADVRKKFVMDIQGKDNFGWQLEVIDPQFISESMSKTPKYNLNQISHDAIIKLLKSAFKELKSVQHVSKLGLCLDLH